MDGREVKGSATSYILLETLVSDCCQWRWKRYGRYGGRHTNLKFGMAAPYLSAEIWAVDF